MESQACEAALRSTPGAASQQEMQCICACWNLSVMTGHDWVELYAKLEHIDGFTPRKSPGLQDQDQDQEIKIKKKF